MVTPAERLTDAAAIYRLTKLVTEDLIFERPREWMLARGGQTAVLISCPWCVSIWAGMAVAIARRTCPSLWDIAASGLAGSTAASLVAERT